MQEKEAESSNKDKCWHNCETTGTVQITKKKLYWPTSQLFSILVDCYQPTLLDNIGVSLSTFENKQNTFYY